MTTKMPVFSGAIAVLLLLGGYGTALGQGTLNFFTYNSANTNLGQVLQYNGSPAVNGTFSAELFVSTNGVAGTFTNAVSPPGVTTFSVGLPGYVIYASDPITLPTQAGYAAGNTLWYELMAWTAGVTYAVASTTPGDQYWTSTAESLTLGGGIYLPQDTDLFPNLTLNLTAVPEPATMALMGLGGLSLMLFRRKKS